MLGKQTLLIYKGALLRACLNVTFQHMPSLFFVRDRQGLSSLYQEKQNEALSWHMYETLKFGKKHLGIKNKR